ncbi:uncharacterized protein BDZ99DRAFT_400033, partial [Mytilinidion resinicola]
MLDPLTAIGLAGNVVQFVDFTAKLIAEGRAIYKAGATSENEDLEVITRDLIGLNGKLLSVSPPDSGSVQESEDEDLQHLAKRCVELGKELLSILEDLRMSGSYTRWDSFRMATRTVRKKDKIEGIQKRLNDIRAQLNLHLIALLRFMEMDRTDQLIQLKDEILMAIQELSQRDKRDRLQKKLLSKEQYLQPEANNVQDLSAISSKLSDLSQEGERVRREQRVLFSLRFRSMDVRHSKIPEAHNTTFNWIFEEAAEDDSLPRVEFMQWLRSSGDIYWLSGKAGSGKSTLTKFIASHPRTMQALSLWAGQHRLFTASHFFWHAGTDLQKSQEGLLQTILYDILRKCPDLIPAVLPFRWQAYGYSFENPEAWTLPELLTALRRLIEHDLSAKFCFFIDGLDEYYGNHVEIISLLRDLITSSNIKICVSSRPWNIFEDAFGKNSSRMLALQDLTRNDIQLYVQNHLEENEHFIRLKTRDPRCVDLVQEIVDRAQGVFLWVFLVVRDLVQGLTNSDRIVDLQRRLRRLPTDLEPYFKHILDTVEDIYKDQTAETFQLCLQARSPPLLMVFSLLDEEDPKFALTSSVSPLSVDEVAARYHEAHRRLNARCKGLLELVGDPIHDYFWETFSVQVDYLHRTVRDFLQGSEMQDYLKMSAGRHFDAHTCLANASLGLIK